MDPQTTPQQETGSIPVNEVVPAPSAPTPPVPAPETPPPAMVAFAEPMHLVVKNSVPDSNKEASTFDPATGVSIGSIADGPFVALGKYETATGVYFTDGTHSVKTVDLSPDPGSSASSPESDGQEQGEKIEVKVLSSVEAMKRSYTAFLSPVRYRAKQATVIHDMAGLLPDVEVIQGSEGSVVGKFERDAVWYYLSATSKTKQDEQGNGPWYGYPVASFVRIDDPNDDLLPQDLFDAADAKEKEQQAGYTSKTNKLAAAAGTSAGLLNRLRGKRAS